MISTLRPADVQIVAASMRSTTTHTYADGAQTTACGRTIGERWTGEYDEGLGWGLPTCTRCLAHVTRAHTALVESARYGIGQTVGILTGVQSVDGPSVSRWGTVVNVAQFWNGVTEYAVRQYDGTVLYFRETLLTDNTRGHAAWLEGMRAREASMTAHPAGKGRPVKIGGSYPHNVPVPVPAGLLDAMDGASQEDWDTLADLLYSNMWDARLTDGNATEYIGADGRTYTAGTCDYDGESALVARHSLGAGGTTFLCGTHSHFA